MKNLRWICVTVGLLVAQLGSAGVSVEMPEKGNFESRNLQKSNSLVEVETYYSANAFRMNAEWVIEGFSLKDSALSTGNYLSNKVYSAESKPIFVPANLGDGEKLHLSLSHEFSVERYYDEVELYIQEEGKEYRRYLHRGGTSKSYEEYLDVTHLAGKNIRLKLQMKSDLSEEGTGWNIRRISLLKTAEGVAEEKVSVRSTVNISSAVADIIYQGFSVYGYPQKMHIYFKPVDQSGKFVNNISLDDLEVKLDGEQIEGMSRNCMSLTRLNSTSNLEVKLSFLMDNSGSMSDDIEGVKSNIIELVERIRQSMKASAGFARFGFLGDCPYVRNPFTRGYFADLTKPEEAEMFVNDWYSNNESTGSLEQYYAVLNDMIDDQSLEWGSNSQKVLIMIGDESALESPNNGDCIKGGGVVYDETEKDKIIKKLNKNGYQLFLIQNSDDASFKGMAEATGGALVDIETEGGYDIIFDKISEALKEKYILTIDLDCLDKTIDECGDHTIEIGIHGTSNTNEINACPYIHVVRTPETQKYDTESVSPNANDVRVGIQAFKVDKNGSKNEIVGNDVTKVTAYLKDSKSTQFSPYIAERIDGAWYAEVPSEMLYENAVVNYCFRIDFSDGSYILTSPEGTEPYDSWTIAVRPNTPPHYRGDEIFTLGGICEPTNVCVTLTDDNNHIEEAFINYRRLGAPDSYTSAPMERQEGDTYCGEIPAAFSVAPGFEYFFSAKDNFGATTYHGSSESPKLKAIEYKVQANEPETKYVTLKSSSYEDCRKFQKGDTIFVYYDNNCTENYQSLSTVYPVTRDNYSLLRFPILVNTNSEGVKNGLNNNDPISISLLRNGTVYDISNGDLFEKDQDGITVNLPYSANLEIEGNWRKIENGGTVCSTTNNTDFGYVTTPKTNEFLIKNYVGCSDVTIESIDFENGNDQFVATVSQTNIPRYTASGFEITYKGEQDADAVAVITFKDVNGDKFIYRFNVSGRKADLSNSCEDVEIFNPLTPSKHTIWIKTIVPSGRLHVYAEDLNGKLIKSFYNGLIHAGNIEVDLYDLVNYKGQYLIVIEREGMPTCSSLLFSNGGE